LTVQSALGEPLRAEVEVPDITAEEAASLKAAVAQPEAFTAAGLEYSAALTQLRRPPFDAASRRSRVHRG